LSHVHVIAGPTGTGKTQAAMELAAAERAPVVVADRIQCYVDLSTTSARFVGLGAPHRHHLGNRTVRDGDYPLDEAFQALLRHIRSLTRQHRYIVVEGGSISLLRRFADCRGRFPFRLTAQVLHVPAGAAYLDRLRARALRMLRGGMLDEFARGWQHVEQRDFVASINGLEALVRWCQDNRAQPPDLLGLAPNGSEMAELVELVAQAHAKHGHEQDATFTRLFGWNHASIVDRQLPAGQCGGFTRQDVGEILGGQSLFQRP
jgi:adenylate dimethylallyltransferase